jgi:hypothetical protein
MSELGSKERDESQAQYWWLKAMMCNGASHVRSTLRLVLWHEIFVQNSNMRCVKIMASSK